MRKFSNISSFYTILQVTCLLSISTSLTPHFAYAKDEYSDPAPVSIQEEQEIPSTSKSVTIPGVIIKRVYTETASPVVTTTTNTPGNGAPGSTSVSIGSPGSPTLTITQPGATATPGATPATGTAPTPATGSAATPGTAATGTTTAPGVATTPAAPGTAVTATPGQNASPATPTNPATSNNGAKAATTTEKPEPATPDVGELPTKSITEPSFGDDSNDKPADDGGFIKKFFSIDQPKKPVKPAVAPLGTAAKAKVKSKAVAKKNEEPKVDDVVLPDEEPKPLPGALQHGEKPIPNPRPDDNYRTQRLPDEVSKKSYSRENEHLPKAVYTEEYKSILFDSAALGNLDILRAMVDDFGDTEVRDSEGNTPLIYAAMGGNLQSIITLASMNANVQARNYNGVSALYAATKQGRVDMVMYILSRADNPDLADKNDETPLMVASELDYSRIAELLLKHGADVNKKMKNGNTALNLAATNKSESTMKLLLATKGIQVDVPNYRGYTPLMSAVESGRESTVTMLINAGADVTKASDQGIDISALASSSGNQTIAEVIESERIRHSLKAAHSEEELAEHPEKAIVKVEALDEEIKAKRIHHIPLPIMRPETKETSENIEPVTPKHKNIQISKKQSIVTPHPSFSSNELKEMRNTNVAGEASSNKVPQPSFTNQELQEIKGSSANALPTPGFSQQEVSQMKGSEISSELTPAKMPTPSFSPDDVAKMKSSNL